MEIICLTRLAARDVSLGSSLKHGLTDRLALSKK